MARGGVGRHGACRAGPGSRRRHAGALRVALRPALAFAAGAVLLAIALLIIAPAALLDARIDALSDGRLRIASAAGTLWQGSGELVLMPAGTRQPLLWRLDAWPLLRGEIRATITLGANGARSATVAYGRDRLDVRDLDVSLPAQSVLLAAAPRAPFAVGGALALHVERLVQLPAINGPLRNSGGDVEIDGQLDVGAAGTARLDATARPRGSDRASADRIAMALAALGAPDGRGGYRVIWTGTWR
ncbi:MAG: type II secretion system protein N [Betaproteobacteria bacterium]|nr:MAG: type II secretion system protein N [Betaproteobacteria bacterium]